MDSLFEEQHAGNEWNDFNNSSYATGYEVPTLFSSLDYSDLQAGNAYADRISTPAYIEYPNLQGSLGGQNSSVDVGEMRTGYEDPTLSLSLDYSDPHAGNAHADRISTPAIEYANLQGSLGGQSSSVDLRETRPEYKEIKALMEENSRQIVQLRQHVAALRPYFAAMRSTLKDLTTQVNRQWVVKTPITPLPKRQDAPSQGGNSGKANKSESIGGEGSGG